MESSPYTEVTLEIFETLWQQGYRQIGVVLQAALYRSENDVARINALGGPHSPRKGRVQGAERRSRIRERRMWTPRTGA